MDEQTLKDIRWLAELVRAQAVSEKKSADALYVAYSDRAFTGQGISAAEAKIARCDRVLTALDKE